MLEGAAVNQERSSTSLNLTTGGITLLGVLVSVGTTVGLGIEGPWWIRLLAGMGTTLALIVAVKLGTGAGRGPVARLANWIIGSSREAR